MQAPMYVHQDNAWKWWVLCDANAEYQIEWTELSRPLRELKVLGSKTKDGPHRRKCVPAASYAAVEE